MIENFKIIYLNFQNFETYDFFLKQYDMQQ